MNRSCSNCGASTDRSYRLCESCFGALHLELCAREGVSPVITDDAALDRIARILRTPTGRVEVAS